MKRALVIAIVALLSFSAIVPAIYIAKKNVEMIDLKGYVWDKNSETWSSCVSANKDNVLRFKISITYHDPDGNGISYKIKWISMVDTLSEGLEYYYNATIGESNISSDKKTITWSNVSGVELFDGDTFSVEFDVLVLENGVHTSKVEIHALEMCPHIWHTKSAIMIICNANLSKSRDVDDDGNGEIALDANKNNEDGYERYVDPDQSSDSILSTDGDNDSKIDHFIDINQSGYPNKYWDPDDNFLSDVVLRDVDGDKTREWIYDSNGDGVYDRYYDPDDGRIHLCDREPPVVHIIKPKEKFLYKNDIVRWRTLLITKIIGPITIKVDAKDNIGIKKVDFYIDGKLRYTDNSTPYKWLWLIKNPLKKIYTIKVIAYDFADNNNSTEIRVWRTGYHPILNHPILITGATAFLISKLIKSSSHEESPPSPPQPPKTKPSNVPPVADAGNSYNGTVGDSISFDGSGSYDPDGTIVNYTWDFGDDETGSGRVSSHSYAKSGRYMVTLTVTDDDGSTAVDETTAIIHEKPKAQGNEVVFWYVVSGFSIILLLALALLFFRRGIFE